MSTEDQKAGIANLSIDKLKDGDKVWLHRHGRVYKAEFRGPSGPITYGAYLWIGKRRVYVGVKKILFADRGTAVMQARDWLAPKFKSTRARLARLDKMQAELNRVVKPWTQSWDNEWIRVQQGTGKVVAYVYAGKKKITWSVEGGTKGTAESVVLAQSAVDAVLGNQDWLFLTKAVMCDLLEQGWA